MRHPGQLCELLWLVDAALDPAEGRAIERSEVIEYVEALGESYTPVRVPRAKFAPKRTDGAAVMRAFVFDRDGCECFTYRGDWFPID